MTAAFILQSTFCRGPHSIQNDSGLPKDWPAGIYTRMLLRSVPRPNGLKKETDRHEGSTAERLA
jgi:hypothetical protein